MRLPLLELLRQLPTLSFPELESPMIFVEIMSPPQQQLLPLTATVAEEIVSASSQSCPEGMAELMPVWLATEYLSTLSTPIDNSPAANAKFINFVRNEA